MYYIFQFGVSVYNNSYKLHINPKLSTLYKMETTTTTTERKHTALFVMILGYGLQINLKFNLMRLVKDCNDISCKP